MAARAVAHGQLVNWQLQRRVDCPRCGVDWPLAPVRRVGAQIEIDCPRCGVLVWRAPMPVPADAARLTLDQLAAYKRAAQGGRAC